MLLLMNQRFVLLRFEMSIRIAGLKDEQFIPVLETLFVKLFNHALWSDESVFLFKPATGIIIVYA